MKNLLTSISLITLCQLSLVACVERECTQEEREAAGADDNDDCVRFVQLETFTSSDTQTESVGWSSGDDVLLIGDIRGVRVSRGDADDEVVVRWKPEAELAQGREQDVIEATWAKVAVELVSSGDQVTFSADRQGSAADVGAKIEVLLPSGFDGDLKIDKTNHRGGDVVIRYLGESKHLEVDMNEMLANLDLADVSSLETAIINTRNDITMGKAFGPNLDAVVLHTDSGDIEAKFSAAPKSHATIVSDFAGDISVDLPGDADFTLTAEAGTSGEIEFSGTPSGCRTARDGEQFAAMVCNEGDPDGLTFDIISDDSVSITF